MSAPAGYRFSRHMPLIPDPISGRWSLAAPLWFEIGGKGSGAWVRVPGGFSSDLATIPPILRPLFNPASARYARAAIVHDYLLSLPDFSPLTAAIAFRDALVAAEVPAWRVCVMAAAVAIWTAAKRGRL